MRRNLTLWLLCIFMTLCCAFGLTACNSNSTDNGDYTNQTQTDDKLDNVDTSDKTNNNNDDGNKSDTSDSDNKTDDAKSDSDSSNKDEDTNGLEYYPLDDGTYAVDIGNALYLSDIVVPETYNGKDVTVILNMQSEKMKSITLPDSVISISEKAFKGCTSLENVTIPNSVTSIGEQAFCGCSKIENIIIPSGVENIGYMMFYQCTFSDFEPKRRNSHISTKKIYSGRITKEN